MRRSLHNSFLYKWQRQNSPRFYAQSFRLNYYLLYYLRINNLKVWPVIFTGGFALSASIYILCDNCQLPLCTLSYFETELMVKGFLELTCIDHEHILMCIGTYNNLMLSIFGIEQKLTVIKHHGGCFQNAKGTHYPLWYQLNESLVFMLTFRCIFYLNPRYFLTFCYNQQRMLCGNVPQSFIQMSLREST